MFSEERQQKIAEILNFKSSIKVNELSEMFNVSESTIRRDLKDMQENGILSRTHGGAMLSSVKSFEPLFKDKEIEMHTEKEEIGRKAASLVENGDTIILDSGTTTLEIAKNLTASNVTVITNSIDIASILSYKENVELIVAGGSLRFTTRAMAGPITEGIFKYFRVDKAFIGANGISIEEGVTTPNIIEAQTKKAMMNVANKIIITSDSSKFNNVCLSVICPLRMVTSIITSSDINSELVEQYKQIGVDILY